MPRSRIGRVLWAIGPLGWWRSRRAAPWTASELVAGRAKYGPAALRAGGELVRRIEGLQPFNRKDAENHPLARLVHHTNHAKHRNPAFTAVRIAAMYDEDRLPRSIRDLPARPVEPVRVGDVLAETPVGTQMVVALFPTIGINRPGTDRWPILITELSR